MVLQFAKTLLIPRYNLHLRNLTIPHGSRYNLRKHNLRNLLYHTETDTISVNTICETFAEADRISVNTICKTLLCTTSNHRKQIQSPWTQFAKPYYTIGKQIQSPWTQFTKPYYRFPADTICEALLYHTEADIISVSTIYETFYTTRKQIRSP